MVNIQKKCKKTPGETPFRGASGRQQLRKPQKLKPGGWIRRAKHPQRPGRPSRQWDGCESLHQAGQPTWNYETLELEWDYLVLFKIL